MSPFMRVVLAGLFVFAGLMAGAGLVFTLFPDGTSPALLGIGLCIWMLWRPKERRARLFRLISNKTAFPRTANSSRSCSLTS